MKKIFGETITPNSPPSNVDILSNNPIYHVAWPRHIPIWDHPLTYYGGKDAFGIEEASKIYKEFVYEEIDEDIVEELADCFITNNWELAPVLKMLFKSEHFFNSATRGAQIQSHQGAFISLYSTLGLEYGVDYFPSGRFFDAQFDPTDPYGYTDWTTPPQVASVGTAHVPIHHSIKDMGHIFFEPPNVAGWPGHRTWINEYTLYKLGDELGKHIQNNFNDSRTPTRQRWRELMIDLVGWDSNDPTEVTKAVAEHFLIVDLLPEQLDGAVAAFKSPVDKSHFNGGFWKLSYMPPMDEDNVVKQFIALMKYLFRLPENFMT